MQDINEVIITGRLTRDPECKQTLRGYPVAVLSIATNRAVKDAQGNWTEATTYLDATCYGKLAENAGKYLAKGRGVLIKGRLAMQTWTDKQTGKERKRIDIEAETIKFLGGGQQQGKQTQQQAAPPQKSGGWQPPRNVREAAQQAAAMDDDDIPF